jgi:hypothetical protein
MKELFTVLMLTLSSFAANAQSFTCSLGQPSCVGFDEKVVKRDAQCFDSMTCFSSGFVCKEDLDKLQSEAIRIQDEARQLASTYDDLYNCVRKAVTIDDNQSCLRKYRYPY